MLAIGQLLNGFKVLSAIGHTRRGEPDGAVIFAVRKDEDGVTWVNARVEQPQIDDPEPAKWWSNGDYHEGEDKYERAHAAFLDRADIVKLEELS